MIESRTACQGLLLAFYVLATNSVTAGYRGCITHPRDDGSPGSLRHEIINANVAGGGEITFCRMTNTVVLGSALPSLTNITIIGPGTVSGDSRYPVFSMNPGATNLLSGIVISDGAVRNDSNGRVLPIAFGAGISNAGCLTLTNCVISNCIISNTGGPLPGPKNRGAGIYNEGELLIQRCHIADCGGGQFTDAFFGGGIANAGSLRMLDSTVSRCNSYGPQGNNGGGGILNWGDLHLTNCVVEDCTTGGQGSGGGLLNTGKLVAYSCAIYGSWAWDGGGVYSTGQLEMRNCVVFQNAVLYGEGAGMLLSGTNTLEACTISENESDGRGIGLFLWQGDTQLANCTVGENRGLFASGDTIEVWQGILRLHHCTIAFNGGAGVANEGGTVLAQNSIFACNEGGDFWGVLNSLGWNLVQDITACTNTGNVAADLLGVDPRLCTLQDYGGETRTCALAPGSPAIDAGLYSSAVVSDQRGVSRPQGPAADIGAYEYQHIVPVVKGLTVQDTTTCRLEVCGLRGGSYLLQSSTNLLEWTTLTNLATDTKGNLEITIDGRDKFPQRFFRTMIPVPAGAAYLPAASGILSGPLAITTNNCIFQAFETTVVTNGGRALYNFAVGVAGAYVIEALVQAPDDGANSVFVNFDGEPQDPGMIWDVLPYTTGYESRLVSWRGGGTHVNNEFAPQVFHLSAGPHRLVIRGREAFTLVERLVVVPYTPAIYFAAADGAPAAPFVLTNGFVYQPVQSDTPSGGGRAVYSFGISQPGRYVIQARVQARDESANSFFINIDAEPQSPGMIWDIQPTTQGVEQRRVTWRGNGTDVSNQFVPKIFDLTQGNHQLIIRGREAHAYLEDLAILPYP